MKAARHSRLSIETPEGVVFSFELATPVSRALAWAIDAAAIAAACSVVGGVCSSANILSSDGATAVSTVLFFVISVVYGILLEWRWRGQTIGKRALGLRVLDIHGMRLQLSQIVLRNLLRLIDTLPALYLVGGIEIGRAHV